ncbi:type III-B CRISPR module RAMP protein Cmr4 [Paenibacillus sp. 1001270B_150601_E10]|uniref:type III-B CRISPR module RAMP protein Cmr4 n=1 Tax=Paenibacillus sp. 1001270B_150601_E10 TaxID=2787079 RepID=UPI0018A0743C|nr:type III-B CRISPR module RAMP protein Cmr4 [Paenibacillus sp. 1001270B_150601_E10]
MKNNKLYFIHCLSPVHVGTGQGVGLVDMPIIRERITEWPFIPGSSMKGVYREHFHSRQSQRWIEAAFGTSNDEEGNAGAIVLSDSKLLAFPVSSRYGTFAYVTCPLAIKRMIRETEAAGITIPPIDIQQFEQILDIKTDEGDEKALVTRSNKTCSKRYIYLDEFKCIGEQDDSADLDNWVSWLSQQLFSDELSRSMFTERFVLVSDDAFQYFVTMCCETMTRIRISSETKAAEAKALWTEEYLPEESVLYGTVWCDKVYGSSASITPQHLLDALSGDISLQIGGNASVGKGRVCCRYAEGDGR